MARPGRPRKIGGKREFYLAKARVRRTARFVFGEADEPDPLHIDLLMGRIADGRGNTLRRGASS